ncbi:MAG: hydroxymethylglutaryl-CoA lyase [Bacteroidetes bacterium]|nr:MAG: hydroxymethylglutaryl-CoA lyase [Bacteroidota bacterium]TAG86670.1 MAG: hydroxymethylglutaryl-CoA lyase [Bacteroidota bacterium]
MKIIECPRDAMQGIHDFIPTATKIDYLNQLLQVGFDTLDFGSFVSPKAIPQMQDTAQVLEKLDLSVTQTKLLAIVANQKGAEQAISFSEITYLGYPLSISQTFQLRNTNKTIEESLILTQELQNLCEKNNKKLVVYLSMGFGNPYNDVYNPEIVEQFTEKLNEMNIKIVALSDTIGVSSPENIVPLFQTLIPKFPMIEFGAHLHSTPSTLIEKINAAYQAGCRRFDGAILGFGGCPMAKDELTGNTATEIMCNFFENKGEILSFNSAHFSTSIQKATEIFTTYH